MKKFPFTPKSKTSARLAAYRAQAAKYPGKDWRYWRRKDLSSAPNNTIGPKGQRYTESTNQFGVYLGDAHKLSRNIDHTGWYADSFQDALIIGGVAKLRCPKGTLYIPVTHNTDSDGTVHYLSDCELVPKGATDDIHDDAIREAARSADHYAERAAEESREFAAKDQAEQDIHDAREEIHKVNRETLALIREIRWSTEFSAVVIGALYQALRTNLRERRVNFKIIDKRQEDFWTAIPGY